MANQALSSDREIRFVVHEIGDLLAAARSNVARQVNSELLTISDPDKRSFYEKEAVNANWSVRELKRQIESSLFERLLLSRGDVKKAFRCKAMLVLPPQRRRRRCACIFSVS